MFYHKYTLLLKSESNLLMKSLVSAIKYLINEGHLRKKYDSVITENLVKEGQTRKCPDKI